MKFERYKIGNFVIGLAFATIGSIYFATPLAAADCERLIDCLDNRYGVNAYYFGQAKIQPGDMVQVGKLPIQTKRICGNKHKDPSVWQEVWGPLRFRVSNNSASRVELSKLFGVNSSQLRRNVSNGSYEIEIVDLALAFPSDDYSFERLERSNCNRAVGNIVVKILVGKIRLIGAVKAHGSHSNGVPFTAIGSASALF